MNDYFNGTEVEASQLVPGSILTIDTYEELKAAGKLWGEG